MDCISLNILDVGHGNGAVLQDDDDVLVVDAGPGTTLLEFLTREGITKIDVLLLSHADRDHIRGVISLLASQISIDLVQVNTDSEKGSDTWDDLTYELDCANKKGKVQFDVGLTTNDTGKFDKGKIHIEILAPTPYLAAKGPGSTDRQGRSLTANSASAVVRLSKVGTPLVLLPSDIDNTGLENLADSQTDAKAPIAVFPHHGAKPGMGDVIMFTERFCQVVAPEIVVFSIGRGQYSTPQPEVVAALRKTKASMRILCTQLSEHCAAKLTGKDLGHLTEKYAKGKEKGVCCAGTIVIELGRDGIVIKPEKASHIAFIKKAVPNSLCLSNFKPTIHDHH